MFWNSVPLMTAIDVAICGAATYVVASFWRKKTLIFQSGSTTGVLLLVGGLTVLALFYAADFISMHVAPAFIPDQSAKDLMRFLHLNVSWPVILTAVVLNIAGLILTSRSVFSALERVSASEARARLAETRLRDAVESMPGPVLLCDDEGRVMMCNRSWHQWYPEIAKELSIGMRREDLLKIIAESGLWDEMGPRDEFLQARISDLKEPTATQEYRYRDGRTVLAKENYTQDGGRIMVHTDITELKQMDRLKDEFISMVSHELRTPLTSIKGSLDLLTAGVTGDQAPDTQRLVGIAKRNADRLLLIVNDILDSQKIESGTMDYHMQPVELVPMVEMSVAANQIFGDTCDITFRVVGDLNGVKINADVQRCEQVLTNLLSNAAKFSPAGSTVEVSVCRMDSCVRVSVHDHGPGIPHEFRDRVFERFSQADTSNARGTSGTGLGLSIAKKFVEAMGGAIGFESYGGGGCTFYFDLPEVQETEFEVA